MEQRLSVDAITPKNTEWTCKVQVVNKFRPRESKDQTVHFQTIITQDENGEHVSIVLYGDDIARYHKLFTPFNTYWVLSAKIREPRPYSIRSSKYEWVVDNYTIVEPITSNDGEEAPLPAPTKLNALSFPAIEHQHPGVEFDLLAVVENCSAMQYTADQTKRYREVIILDHRQ